jgi:hypothetical protein
MIRKISIIILTVFCLVFILSCSRSGKGEAGDPNSVMASHLGAWPMAILKTGENPLWFQLTEGGPAILETIEDAVSTEALVPWPLAMHVRFFHEGQNEVIMAINRDGFLKLSVYPDVQDGIALYRFSGGEYWRQYTIGGLFFYENRAVALLYLDDRFINVPYPPPLSRTWTFNMASNSPFPARIPVLELFPAEDDWEADTVRLGDDGFIYYRVVKRTGADPVVRVRRTKNLSDAGEEISNEVFFNSAPKREIITHPSLPPLPVGFSYTGIGTVNDSLVASWEEQEDFSIGAAGFVVIKIK